MKTIFFLASSFFSLSVFGQYFDFDSSKFPLRFESTTCYASDYDSAQKKMVFSKKQDCHLLFVFHSKKFITVNNEVNSCFRLLSLLSDDMIDGIETRLYEALDENNVRCAIAMIFYNEKPAISIKVIYSRFSILYTNE